ncbi:hypothetical protein [Xanthomonas hortorum]|uniref:hypothetical protein n=1 Tax=Xanthomonas hortorum TaxID=56454 RepID=UPI0015936AB6|nr:hypothetical protein [Xanthomonas hortorum]NHF66524.1 hypothetical protein [Xanthomonas hortorum]
MLARFLKSALLGLCILVALLVALYAISARWPIPEAQRQALAQLRQPPLPLRGPNMFVALWSLPYAVPDAQREALLAQDVQRFEGLPAGMLLQSAATRYPRRPDWPASAPELCTRYDGCLDRVRQRPQAYADALATQTRQLITLRDLAGYADYRSPFPPSATAPLPTLPRFKLSMTSNALDFVQGRTEQALAGVCADARIARVLLRSGDNLIMPMVGAAMLRTSAHLFAEMLAELPAKHPLPAQCLTAFAPLAVDEVSLCNALHGESRMVLSMLETEVRKDPATDLSWDERLSLRLLDHERTRALMAPTYTWACSAPVRTLLAQDQAVPQAMIPVPDTVSMGCIANAVGCLLAGMARPDYAQYQHKLQDTAAALRALSAVLWLRDHPNDAQTLEQRLAGLPPALRGQARPLQPGADGRSVQLRQYARPEEKVVEDQWPLAGSKRPPEPAAISIKRS